MIIKIPGRGPIAIYGDGMFVSIPGDGPVEVSEVVVAGGGPSGDALLNEDGTYILNEDGTYILQEAP